MIRSSAVCLVLFAIGLTSACGDQEPGADTDIGTGTDTETETDTTAPPEDSVTGTVQRSNGSDTQLVDGHAYLDEGQGGAVRIILTDFAVDCAMIEDGLGFNTPRGGAWIGFEAEGFRNAQLFEGDGTQTDLKKQYPGSVEVVTEDTQEVGTLSLEGDKGSATFRVTNCGSMDPFGS
ncbi:MAG: hypothetical protein ACI9MC_002106 [Kiritimatiellia bacterium]|jgi:hypothetical protein